MSNVKKQSNPFSTGGGGVNFETRVQATFLLAMLTNCYLPCLPLAMKARELNFQSKYKEIHTEDFVLHAEDKSGNVSKIFAQVKHEISIGGGEKTEFSEVINAAWIDFDGRNFDASKDCIALITGPLAKVDIRETLPILEWAKFSSSSEDFKLKVNKEGFTSSNKINKLNAFKDQLSKAKGSVISDDELWRFLRVFHILSYDLDSSTSIVANLLHEHISSHSNESPTLVLSRLVTYAQECNQNAATIKLNDIPNDIGLLFEDTTQKDRDVDIKKLQDRSDLIYKDLKNVISDFHIDRTDYLMKLSELEKDSDLIFVTGTRGTGKSGLVKEFINLKKPTVPVFYLRADDFNKSHLNDVFSSFGMTQSSIGDIEKYFSLIPEKILVIESIERVLELDLDNAFIDLLNLLNRQSGWKVIVTGRDYAYQQLTFTYFQPRGIKFSSLNVEKLNDVELNSLYENIPELGDIVLGSSLSELFRIPFFANLAVIAVRSGAKFEPNFGEQEFQNVVWESVISKDSDRRNGMYLRRSAIFIEIAKKRAKEMVFMIPDQEYDPEVLAKLEEDNLILRDTYNSLITITHDVMEDWALGKYIQKEYVNYSDDIDTFVSSIGNEPAINRAYRLWLHMKLIAKDISQDFVYHLLTSNQIEKHWKDETISALLQSEDPDALIKLLRDDLIKNECDLLIRFCFILRISCQKSKLEHINISKVGMSGLIDSLFLEPNGHGWDAIIDFTYEYRMELSDSVRPHLVELLSDWLHLVNINNELPKKSRTVGLLALWLLEPLKDTYRRGNDIRDKVLDIILSVSSTIQEEFNALLAEDVFVSKKESRRLSYVDKLTSMALNSVRTPILCKYMPELVIKIARHEWMYEEKETESDYYSYRDPDLEESFGLDRTREYFPATGAKGPFKFLLIFHPRLGLDFIIDLCNKTVAKYAGSSHGSIQTDGSGYNSQVLIANQVNLYLNDETVVKQYSAPILWNGYRGLSTMPYLLQSVLMAFENWLITYVENVDSESIEWIFDHILRLSNSTMLTSVLSSVATGFPNKVGLASLPLLRTPELYSLDLARSVNEMGDNSLHFFSPFNRTVMTDLYIDERREAALRPWRQERLENLLIKLQLHKEFKDEIYIVLDELIEKAKQTQSESLRFMLNRADTRNWEVVEDKDNNRVVITAAESLPEDLKEISEKSENNAKLYGEVSRLGLWSRSLLESGEFKGQYFSSYQEAIDVAKKIMSAYENNELEDFSEMSIGYVVKTMVACIKDYSSKLSDVDIALCRKILYESVTVNADIENGSVRHDVTDFLGSAASAYVLPIFFDFVEDAKGKENLKSVIAIALTHENNHIRHNTSKGIRDFLWDREPNLARAYVATSLEYAKLRKIESESRRNYTSDENEIKKREEEWSREISEFRKSCVNGEHVLDIDGFNLETYYSWFISAPIWIIPLGTTDLDYIKLLKKTTELAIGDEYRDYRSNKSEKINHDVKKSIFECFTEHVKHSRKNNHETYNDIIEKMCQKAPSRAYLLKLSIDVDMEEEDDIDGLWESWVFFIPFIERLVTRDLSIESRNFQHDVNSFIRGMLYADRNWTIDDKTLKDMELGVIPMIQFCERYGANSHVFEALSSLMYNFPQLFFAQGLLIIKQHLVNNPELITERANSGFYLERSIQRYLLVDVPGALGRDNFDACMHLLDTVIETGSARAYYLRDHLIKSRRVH